MSSRVVPTAHRKTFGRAGRAVRGCVLAAVAALGVAACSSVTSHQALRAAQPCGPGDGAAEAGSGCPGQGNVLVAMASGQPIARDDVVERRVLDQQRGGYIVAGGMRIDFGFRFETIVNGVPQLTSVLTYDEILANHGRFANPSSIVLGGGELGTTRIIHAVGGPNGIGTTIITDQSGIDIRSVSVLAIDILNLTRLHKGGPNIGRGHRPLPLELHQAFVNSLQ
ncbi:hypothetical protein AAFN88_16065 [Pelagibius sp. CAU 1746]|uniref:hypothetical protein n=1 Tax=Pelagibius sp. CAU 1746 TaxID=3140370 RepID=UPI00325AB28D